jgi:hypothetical protein
MKFSFWTFLIKEEVAIKKKMHFSLVTNQRSCEMSSVFQVQPPGDALKVSSIQCVTRPVIKWRLV